MVVSHQSQQEEQNSVLHRTKWVKFRTNDFWRSVKLFVPPCGNRAEMFSCDFVSVGCRKQKRKRGTEVKRVRENVSVTFR